jgi:hypothetical protein
MHASTLSAYQKMHAMLPKNRLAFKVNVTLTCRSSIQILGHQLFKTNASMKFDDQGTIDYQDIGRKPFWHKKGQYDMNICELNPKAI